MRREVEDVEEFLALWVRQLGPETPDSDWIEATSALKAVRAHKAAVKARNQKNGTGSGAARRAEAARRRQIALEINAGLGAGAASTRTRIRLIRLYWPREAGKPPCTETVRKYLSG